MFLGRPLLFLLFKIPFRVLVGVHIMCRGLRGSVWEKEKRLRPVVLVVVVVVAVAGVAE